jgi:hypothetical protein
MRIERNGFRYNISKIAEFKNNGYYSGCYYEVSKFSSAWNEWISLKNFASLEEAKMWIDYQIASI